jgi:plastocyanin
METDSQQQPSNHNGSKKRLLLTLAGIVVVAILAAAAFFIWRANNTETQSTEDATVSLTSAGFVPQTIRIAPGQSITWTNDDSQVHKLEADQPELEELNVELNPGDSFDFTFEDSGSYSYHDPLNPELFKGYIIVE